MAKKIKLNPRRFFHKVVIMDNSVLLKAFYNEEGAEQVRKLLNMSIKKECTLLAPALLEFEFLNSISKSYNNFTDVDKAYNKFKKLDIGMINPTDKYVMEAILDVYNVSQISYYDASYHALARDLDAVFLTADKKYYDLMKKKGHVELFC
ncbi:MAG: type II toxin-antitoxin system VapC family toxin [Candidatus Peregrinibacteria bacterium]